MMFGLAWVGGKQIIVYIKNPTKAIMTPGHNPTHEKSAKKKEASTAEEINVIRKPTNAILQPTNATKKISEKNGWNYDLGRF